MADYGTTYVFRIDVEGKEAVTAATKLRKDLDAAISGGQTTAIEVARLRDSYHELAFEADVAGNMLTSITRRMTYQRKGMKETEASILSLGTHYQTLAKLMGEAGTEPFATMIQGALEMKDKLVGHSIIPDMVYEAIEYFKTLRSYGVGTFEAIVQSAQPLQRFSETMDLNVPGMANVPQPDPDVAAVGKTPFAGMAEDAKVAAREAGKVTTEMDKLNSAINEATIQHFGMRRIGYGLAYSGRVVARAGEALSGSLMGTSEEYLKFEQRATIAGIAMEMQTDQIDDLEKAILDTSVALALFEPEELLEGTRQWAAGTGVVIEGQEQLNKLLEETIDIQKMAALNSVDLGKSVDTVGGVMHEFGLETKDVTHITEVLNFVAAKTFANVLDVGDAFKMVGPIASQLGISMEEVAVTIGLVSDANIKGSRAGRALRQMFQRLLKPTREYDEMMQTLVKDSLDVGETWQDLIMPGGVFVGMSEYFDILAEATEGYTSAERAAALATLATANELPALVHIVERTIELRREGKSLIDEELNAVLDAHGLMTRSFETLEESESYRVDQMKRRWEAATVEMGGAVEKNMLPYMEAWYDLITGIVEGLTENPEVLKWLALSGFGLQGVGTAVGGLGEAINIGANVAIMATAVEKFGDFTKIFKTAATGLVGALATLAPLAVGLAYVASLPKAAQKEASERQGMEEIEKAYPAAARERLYQEVSIAPWGGSGLGLMSAKSKELQEIFQELFGEQWAKDSSENIAKVLDALAPMLGPLEGAGTAEGTMPDWSELVLPTTATPAIPNEAEALMQYLEYLNRIDEITENYQEQRQQSIDGQLAWEADALEAFLQQEEERRVEHYRTLARAQEDQLAKLAKLYGSYLEATLEAEATLQKRLADLLEDYTKKESRYEEDALAKRASLAEDYRTNELEEEEDFQRKLQRLELDHLTRMDALIRTRDARGLLLEVQEYTRSTKEEHEDYGIERQRARQDLLEAQTEIDEKYALQKARRLEDYQEKLDELKENQALQKEERLADYEDRKAELEAEYELRKARRIEDYELKRAEAQEQYALQLEERREALTEELTELEEAWKEQLTALEDSEKEKLAALIGAETKQEEYLREHYATVLKDFKLFLKDYDDVWQQFTVTSLEISPAVIDRMRLLALATDSLPTTKNRETAYSDWEKYRLPPGMQEGGYAPSGIYTLGEAGREFVLSAPTTQAVERQLGAPLGQSSFGGLGGSEIVVNQSNWQFNGTFTEGDREWFRAAAKEAAYEGIVEVVSG